MRVFLHGESDLSLHDFDQPGFEVEAPEGVHAHFSALEMFATSLGLCTGSVLLAYAEAIDAPVDRLAVRLKWSYVPGPFRVGAIEMRIHWPELPESRLAAAERAAGSCTIHHTLEHPPKVSTTVTLEPLEAGKEEGAQLPAPLP